MELKDDLFKTNSNRKSLVSIFFKMKTLILYVDHERVGAGKLSSYF
jgi:hypothetical protein